MIVQNKSSKWKPDNTQTNKNESGEIFYKVDPKALQSGCPGKDCIKSIDDPQYMPAADADNWLDEGELIFGVNHNGIQKAYPEKIMTRHEIVNDFFGDKPIVVTYCPLCGTAISFASLVNGKASEFGVSGLLLNSDLVMYDRNEQNLWQQATGEAIVGEAARRGEFLKMLSTTGTTWAKWKEKYPNTLVLSSDGNKDLTNYPSSSPYGDYSTNSRIGIGHSVNNTDKIGKTHPKTITYGILVNGSAKAYTKEALERDSSFRDEVGGIEIKVELNKSGEATFTNIATQEKIIPLRGFWFAWVAFHPDTELYN